MYCGVATSPGNAGREEKAKVLYPNNPKNNLMMLYKISGIIQINLKIQHN